MEMLFCMAFSGFDDDICIYTSQINIANFELMTFNNNGTCIASEPATKAFMSILQDSNTRKKMKKEIPRY